MADARFVSLTTFRRSGEPVSTPVWVGRDGTSLVVLTPADSGKVKRLRHDPRVEVRPCGRFGAVADGVEPVSGTAELREHTDDVERARATIRATYPIESRLVLGIERLVERLRGRPRTERLALLIT
jgi:PPOX class probable F420-dependent enzyme